MDFTVAVYGLAHHLPQSVNGLGVTISSSLSAQIGHFSADIQESMVRSTGSRGITHNLPRRVDRQSRARCTPQRTQVGHVSIAIQKRVLCTCAGFRLSHNLSRVIYGI